MLLLVLFLLLVLLLLLLCAARRDASVLVLLPSALLLPPRLFRKFLDRALLEPLKKSHARKPTASLRRSFRSFTLR